MWYRRPPQSHLGWELALHVLDLAPEHEGLQDLVQAVDDDHALLHGHVVLPPRPGGRLAKAVAKPLSKLVLVVKDLPQQRRGLKRVPWPYLCGCNVVRAPGGYLKVDSKTHILGVGRCDLVSALPDLTSY